jgi:hypothetical protein
MNKLFIIYKCTNLINGKIYIGLTSRILKTRIQWHFNELGGSNKFKQDLKYFSKKDFRWETVYTTYNRIEANLKEKELIQFYNTIESGYNSRRGGDSFEKGIFLPFEEAKKFAQKLNLKTSREWRNFCKSGERPLNIPSYPDQAYKKDWKGVSDWLIAK